MTAVPVTLQPGARVRCTEFGLTLTGTILDVRDLGGRLDVAIKADHDGQQYHRPASTLTPLQEDRSMTGTSTTRAKRAKKTEPAMPPVTTTDDVHTPSGAERFPIGTRVRLPIPVEGRGWTTAEGTVVLCYDEAARALHHADCLVRLDTTGAEVQEEYGHFETMELVDVTAPTAVTPILATSDLQVLPFHRLQASALNPRKTFDEAALAELAESIAHKGLMQNLVGRPLLNGNVEIIAGGRRFLALQRLVDAGRLPEDHPVPVRVQDLGDLEALQLATAENVERRSMTPLEEADAFAQMIALGATREDLALKFGYTDRTIEQRLLLARDLDPDSRALLDANHITLAQAQVIAQTTGPLRQHVVAAAKTGEPAPRLRAMVARSSFLVQHAKFDVQASGLEVVEDLFGDTPAHFADPKAALALQLDWVNARAEKLRKKNKHHFVEVVQRASTHVSVGYPEYNHYSAHDDLKGVVIAVSLTTGEVKEHTGLVRDADEKARKKAETAARTGAANPEAAATERPISNAAFEGIHQQRAHALREALLGDTHRTLALTVHALLADVGQDAGSANVQLHDVYVGHVKPAAIDAALTALQDRLAAALGVQIRLPRLTLGVYASGSITLSLYDYLVALPTEELLSLLNVLVSASYYCSPFQPDRPGAPVFLRVAAETNADRFLARDFKLDDLFLKRLPRSALLKLADEAGLDRAELEACGTQKEMRQAILAHAERLHDAGFVPTLVRFPTLEHA